MVRSEERVHFIEGFDFVNTKQAELPVTRLCECFRATRGVPRLPAKLQTDGLEEDPARQKLWRRVWRVRTLADIAMGVGPTVGKPAQRT